MAVTKKLIEKLGIEVSMLGCGCMRFPTSEGKIDEERAQKIADICNQNGITKQQLINALNNNNLR